MYTGTFKMSEKKKLQNYLLQKARGEAPEANRLPGLPGPPVGARARARARARALSIEDQKSKNTLSIGGVSKKRGKKKKNWKKNLIDKKSNFKEGNGYY